MDFKDRYGPWAVIAGASEGTGRAFAQLVAAQGVNCILLARRAGPLEELAAQLRADHGVEVVTASVDLAALTASAQIAQIAQGYEVGLYISNAGSDPHGSYFLDKPIEAWDELVTRNVLSAMRCCHHFGGAMKARGKGGLLLVGSGACYGSGPNLAVYSGSKAFEMCFAEGLWVELQGSGVDVLYLAMSMTDTPALRALLAEKGLPVPANIAEPEAVARLGLERLPFGPIQNWGLKDDEEGGGMPSAAGRRARVEMIAQVSKHVFGGDKKP